MFKRCAVLVAGMLAAGAAAQQATVLTRDEAAKIMPETVFYRGQTAGIQARNATGIKFADGALLLTAVVDTSGYSSALQQSYQAYLITEVSLQIGGQTLRPGAYGYGFVAHDKMVVLDLGGHELLRASTHADPDLKRPNPLQIVPEADGKRFRLYMGRNFVALSPLPSASPATP